jgi:predicted amino acid dehydrogenase
VRVAFVSHYVFPEREMVMTEPSLRRLTMAARRSLFDRLSALLEMKPMLAFARNLFGGRVWFASLTLAVDAAALERAHASGSVRVETERIQEAVDRAASLGCTAVALGAYTSIIAGNGLGILPPPGVRITTGNTFASVVEARRLLDACRAAGVDPARARLGVVGATGNIGASLAGRLSLGSPAFRDLLLVGRNTAALERVKAGLHAAAPRCEIGLSTDLGALRTCDAVAIAVGTNEPLLYPEHLAADRPVIVADISTPSVVSARARALGNVTVIPQAGTVRVPGAPSFVVSSHTPEGTAFCCAAEVMLLGLEPARTAALALVGDIEPESMRVIEALAEAHGLLEELGGVEIGFHG